jgi:hypothetical protein
MSEHQHQAPHLKLPSKQERRGAHRRHIRDLLDTCQLQHPLRAGCESGGAGACKAAQAVQALVESPPRQFDFYPGVID